jgi:isopenicillin-N epimerase
MMLTEGDEICTTDHEYGACDRAWEHYCVSQGVRYVRAEIPMPVPSMREIAEIIWNKVTPKTKVLFLSHITSPTGLRLPVEELCARAREAGIISVIDGSHSPGHIPLDLSTLQADVYTANCHKWMCTPKGSAFLWVAPHLQEKIIPLVVSWGARNPVAGDGPLNVEHEFIGTRDYSPFLSVPFAIDLMAQQPWDRAQERGRMLTQRAHDALAALPGIQSMRVDGQDPLLQMATVILPSHIDTDHMKQWLYMERAIEVVVHRWLNVPILRCSTHLHTEQSDVDVLVKAVEEYLTGSALRESF